MPAAAEVFHRVAADAAVEDGDGFLRLAQGEEVRDETHVAAAQRGIGRFAPAAIGDAVPDEEESLAVFNLGGHGREERDRPRLYGSVDVKSYEPDASWKVAKLSRHSPAVTPSAPEAARPPSCTDSLCFEGR